MESHGCTIIEETIDRIRQTDDKMNMNHLNSHVLLVLCNANYLFYSFIIS